MDWNIVLELLIVSEHFYLTFTFSKQDFCVKDCHKLTLSVSLKWSWALLVLNNEAINDIS